jgi:thermitase
MRFPRRERRTIDERISRVTLVAVLIGLGCLLPASAHAADVSYDPHTVIVRYADGALAAERAAAAERAGVVAQVGSITGVGADVVRVEGDPAEAAQRLAGDVAVRYAEPNWLMRATATQTPNDTYFYLLDNLSNTGQRGGAVDADIDAPEGWGLQPALIGFASDTSGVEVGIVDTGVMTTHEELTGKIFRCAGVASTGQSPDLATADPTIVQGRCEDDNGHGTHVAGILAARANNGAGIAGVAFNSPLAVCRALGGTYGGGTVAGIANCITWLAQQGVKIISMSIGGLGQSTALGDAISNASRTALLLAAAGNDSSTGTSYPAGYAEVISVAATDRDDSHAFFSNYNKDVEIAAPGVSIPSAMKDGGYILLSGTSMSVPHVSGAAALIAAGGGTPSDWRSKLSRSVDDLGVRGRDRYFGYGRINLTKALTPDVQSGGTGGKPAR